MNKKTSNENAKTEQVRKKKKEDDIKQNLKKSHQHWNDWIFQIHLNKLEWVFLKSRNVKKKPFLHPQVYLKDKSLKTIGLDIH